MYLIVGSNLDTTKLKVNANLLGCTQAINTASQLFTTLPAFAIGSLQVLINTHKHTHHITDKHTIPDTHPQHTPTSPLQDVPN
jgi:hypothetical protein